MHLEHWPFSANDVFLLQKQRYNLLCASTALLYDYLVTFDDEVRLIWSHKLGIASILFLVSRCVTLISLLCYVFTAYPVWTVNLQSIRRYNVSSGWPYNNIFSCELDHDTSDWTITVVIMALAGTAFGKGLIMIPDNIIASSKLCLLSRAVGPSFSVFWATPLVLDTTIFILTIRKTGHLAKNRASPIPITSIGIMKVYLRDGTMYYVIVCLTHLVNFLATLVAPSGVKALSGSFGQSLSTVLVCRLVLSLRKEGERNTRQRTAPDARATTSDGVLSSCAIASFFHVDLNSEPDSNEATRGTAEPSVASVDRDLERDMQSAESEGIAMTVFKD